MSYLNSFCLVIGVCITGLFFSNTTTTSISAPGDKQSSEITISATNLINHGTVSSLDFEDGMDEMLLPQETLPAGTLIIAMDNTLQGGGTFNMRAYGLAVSLLHADIPLKWIINSTKAKDGTDFTASARLRYPSTGSYASRAFKAGPIAIFPGFESQAMSVINIFNAGGTAVNVYELQNSVSNVPVYANLTHKPKAGVINDGGRADIHTNILTVAGLTEGTHFDVIPTGAGLNNTSCYTFISEPHTEQSDIEDFGGSSTSAVIEGVRVFIQSGGNFLGQCHGVEAFTNPQFTNKLYGTFASKNATLGTITYANHSNPFAQFEGILPEQGGSVTSWKFNGTPSPAGLIIVSDNNVDPSLRAYVSGSPINGFDPSKNAGGYVHYLAGHEYPNGSNGQRMYLNAFLRPADRPSNCDLVIPPQTVADKGILTGCGQTVLVNVVTNDIDPVGEGLTMTVTGVGTKGTFTKSGSNSISYTPDPGPWLGPDMVTYEVCDVNNNCAEGVLTICGENNVKISGKVFGDTDFDGALDGGEPGQVGVTIRLYADFNNDGNPDGAAIDSKVTDTNGEYTFTPTLSFTAGTPVDTRVSNENDDARQKVDGNVETDKDFKIKDGDDAQQAIRFTGINIPQNAIITNAYIEFTAFSTKNGTPSSTVIRGETATETPPGFIDGNPKNQLSDRLNANGTTSSVNWNNIPTWADLQKYQTPDLTSIVSEIRSDVNGSTTAAFNGNMVFFFNSPSGSQERKAYDFGATNDSSRRPRLVIQYSTLGNNGKYLIDIDESSLPAGSSLTTDNTESVSFTNTGQLDCDNDFGFKIIAAIAEQPKCVDQKGKITVTSPIGAYQYKLNNGAYQSSPVFLNLEDGIYTLTVKSTQSQIEMVLPGSMTIQNVVCAENDINQTPINTPVSGNILTNDEDGQGYGQLVASATYRNMAGNWVNLPFNTPTAVYDANNVLAGTIILNNTGGYTYTPATDYTGDVPIHYILKDDQTSPHRDNATLMIKVVGNNTGNNPPIAQDDTNSTEAGVPVSDNVVPPNDSDIDGDVLTVISARKDTDSDGVPDASMTIGGAATIISGIDTDGNPVANAGTLTIAANGVYTFTPNANIDGMGTPFTGKVYADYTISDGNGGTDSATLTIDVMDAGANNTFANDDANIGPQGEPQTGNIMTNDHDPELDTQTIGMIDSDGDGVMDFVVTTGNPITITQGGNTIGTLTINKSTGAYTWNPVSTFKGTAVVPYSTCDDGSPGSVCDEATLYLTTYGCTDLTITLKVTPSIVIGNNVTVECRIVMAELNSEATDGSVIGVFFPTSNLYTIQAYNPNATTMAGLPVLNSQWKYLGVFGSNYLFQFEDIPNADVFPSSGLTAFGFKLTYSTNNTAGVENIVARLFQGSGGECNLNNNTDSETFNFSFESNQE